MVALQPNANESYIDHTDQIRVLPTSNIYFSRFLEPVEIEKSS